MSANNNSQSVEPPAGANSKHQETVEQLAHRVLESIKELGLPGTWAQGAKDRASDIINKRALNEKLQAADVLAAGLKKGNARAQAFAAEILDVLQLRLPGIGDHPQSKPTAPDRQMPPADESNPPCAAAGVVAISELKMVKPFYGLFPISRRRQMIIEVSIMVIGYDNAHPVVVWAGKNIVIDGHMRIKAARQAGLTHVPVVYREFSDEDQAVNYAVHAQLDQLTRRDLTEAQIRAVQPALIERRMRAERTNACRKALAHIAVTGELLRQISPSLIKDVEGLVVKIRELVPENHAN